MDIHTFKYRATLLLKTIFFSSIFCGDSWLLFITFFFDTKKLEETVESADENPPTNYREDTAEENPPNEYREGSDDYREEYDTEKSQDYDDNNHIQGALLSRIFKKKCLWGKGVVIIFQGQFE